MRELRGTDLSADPIHEEQLFALSHTPYCSIYVALMGITTPSSADIPTILVTTAFFYNSPISLEGITTVSRMMSFFSQPIVAMHCAITSPIDIYPGIIQCRVPYPSPLIPRPGTRLEILPVKYQQRQTVVVTWEEPRQHHYTTKSI